MKLLFGFFLRLFLALVAAKVFGRLMGLEGTGALLGLTLLFIILVYGVSHLLSSNDQAIRPGSEAKAVVTKDSRP